MLSIALAFVSWLLAVAYDPLTFMEVGRCGGRLLPSRLLAVRPGDTVRRARRHRLSGDQGFCLYVRGIYQLMWAVSHLICLNVCSVFGPNLGTCIDAQSSPESLCFFVIIAEL